MYMLLMGLCITFFALAVTVAAFAAATRPTESTEIQPELPAVKTPPARFFAAHSDTSVPVLPQVPIEVLIQQIETHVRLEQAAAESFVAYPTQALLHSRTTSPFVN
jgi:hypothetical protein